MYCGKCGAEIKEGQKFCPKCGTPVNIPDTGHKKQSVRTANRKKANTSGTAAGHINPRIVIIAVLAVIAVIIIVGIARRGTGTSTPQSHSGSLIVQEYRTDSDGYLFLRRNKICSNCNPDKVVRITFLDTMDSAPEDCWDVSDLEDGSVVAWVEPNGSEFYDLYIAGEGGVYANPDSSFLFSGYANLQSINFNDCFYIDDLVDMSYMFAACEQLTTIDVSGWDTSGVTGMARVFSKCYVLESVDVSGWDTSNVTDMSYMFSHDRALLSPDISSWDTSNVTDMKYMFDFCTSIQSLDLSGFDTSNVTDMQNMFAYCYALTSLDLGGWDTSNVTNMAQMFTDCYELRSLDVSSWDTSNVTDMTDMFLENSFLTSLDISNWDTSAAGITVEELGDQRYQ